MDLLAAFFFSTFVIKHLNREKQNPLPIFLKSSLLGASLLSATYFILVLLGSFYSHILAGTPPQEMLGKIAENALGVFAAPVICVAVVLACLTTAIVLTSLFSEFLKKEISRDKLPMSASLAITLIIAFFVSTLEFAGIMKIIGPILEYTYPGLIIFTIFNIVQKMRPAVKLS